MKIIKYNYREDDVARFECKMCGCVFEAEPDEYHEYMLFSDVAFRNPPYCKCPMCNNFVWHGERNERNNL